MQFLRTIFALALLATSLVSNADTSNTEQNSTTNEKKFIVIPTGTIQFRSKSDFLGGTFGAIGAVLESGASSDVNKDLESLIRNALPTEKIHQIVNEAIIKSLKNKNYSDVVIESASEINTKYSDWYNNDQKKLDTNYEKNTLIVEYGFAIISYSKYFRGDYIDAQIGVRILDATNGKVISKARTYAVRESGGEKINVDLKNLNNDEKNKVLQEALSNLLQRIAKQTVEKVI